MTDPRGRNVSWLVASIASIILMSSWARADERPLAADWDYASGMKVVAKGFHGRIGVVLHVGDSLTYANPYSQWARDGRGKTDGDRSILTWMHAGANDDSDGWWLARFDHPDGGRSHTAASGLRADELIAGGKHNLPSLAVMLARYQPQMVVLMIGTNDASANRPVDLYRADVARAVDEILARQAIPILSTISPHPQRVALARSYNEALRALARAKLIPLIDLEREILKRRPSDWDGSLLQKGEVHPTASNGGASPISAPTAENLRQSGYLLRGWLSVRAIAEVKRSVIDQIKTAKTEVPSRDATESLKLAVKRDAWVSNVGNEAKGNNGGSPQLKLKSHQEMSIIDIDPAPLRGRVIQSATLHVHVSATERLHRVTVGGVGAEWTEGNGTNYDPKAIGASHNFRKNPDLPWTASGGDLCHVILGQGGTSWRMADATAADAKGWQTIAVDPTILAARSAGVSHGLLLFDDTGSEWTRQGEKFTVRLFPNRFIHSKDSNTASAPYLTVVLGAADKSPPDAPGDVRSDAAVLPAGEAIVSWITPRDRGEAGVIGFLVSLDGKSAPRYLIPLAKKTGERVEMHLRDLALKAGAEVAFSVQAVDGAGNVGRATSAKVRVSDHQPKPLPPAVAELPAPARSALPKLGNLEFFVIDELDKLQPISGAMIPAQTKEYLAENHVWSAATKTIQLHAARNEFVGFQIVMRGGPGQVSLLLTFDDGSITNEIRRYHHVATSKGPLPDPIAPINDPDDQAIVNRKTSSLYAEVYVPHIVNPGDHTGKLAITRDGKTLNIDVKLKVWDFTLPDSLSFLPEMNCYGLPEKERDYYRLAHKHRTILNRVPYHHDGSVDPGCAPRWDGRRLEWTEWDKRFGPYFDGSAFDDLPRRGVPIERFYLPLHENWPSPIEPNYNGGYWADRAFTDSYRSAFVSASRQFTEHMNVQGWNDTLFQCFFNGKNNFKARGWSRGSSPWLLDEPASFQDFWALRYFGIAFHEGVNQAAPGRAKMVFRCDVSRPEWQRDALDGLLDDNVVGGALRKYSRLVFDRKRANGEIVLEYGGTNPIEASNVQPVGWSLDAWSIGADGVLPWQTVGTDQSWTKADELALFYPVRAGLGAEPLPSIRLKAYRRGQQDVEYLTWLARVTNEPRWAIGKNVRETLRLAAERQSAGGDDAGRMNYSRLKPQDLWALRVRVGQAVSNLHPPAENRLIEFRTPRRDLSRLAPGYVSGRGEAK
jgi:lysophospholipase L1-like esterase